MLCVFMCPKRAKVTELVQTFNEHAFNQCSFVYNGKQYRGEGKPLTGISRMLNQQRYMWTIYTDDGRKVLTFGINDANTPIQKRKLSKWMKEFVK